MQTCRHSRQLGFGTIELLVTISIFAVLTAVGLSSIDRRRHDINTTVRRITADFRWARARAVVSGDHFRFHVTSDNSYQIERLAEINGNWTVRSVTQRATLPDHIVLQPATEETDLDSRGVVVYADAADAIPAEWKINDQRFGALRTLTLYPSGQIHADQ